MFIFVFTKFLSILHHLKLYLDTSRPDFSDFRSEALVTNLSILFLNNLFLNTSLHSRIKLS